MRRWSFRRPEGIKGRDYGGNGGKEGGRGDTRWGRTLSGGRDHCGTIQITGVNRWVCWHRWSMEGKEGMFDWEDHYRRKWINNVHFQYWSIFHLVPFVLWQWMKVLLSPFPALLHSVNLPHLSSGSSGYLYSMNYWVSPNHCLCKEKGCLFGWWDHWGFRVRDLQCSYENDESQCLWWVAERLNR